MRTNPANFVLFTPFTQQEAYVRKGSRCEGKKKKLFFLKACDKIFATAYA